MSRLRHTIRPHGPTHQATAMPNATADFVQTVAECGERYIVSRAELFDRLARCTTPAEATAVTTTWFQHRLSEVAEQNQRLFQAWLAMGMSGWHAATGNAAPNELPTQTQAPPQPPTSHHARDIAA
ncbi:MAG: hypothetical protein IT557_09095 [Alphaproteobacteria bacterium]|nr:hypothetical protein [Alphaproteobacteria bacterium]